MWCMYMEYGVRLYIWYMICDYLGCSMIFVCDLSCDYLGCSIILVCGYILLIWHDHWLDAFDSVIPPDVDVTRKYRVQIESQRKK